MRIAQESSIIISRSLPPVGWMSDCGRRYHITERPDGEIPGALGSGLGIVPGCLPDVVSTGRDHRQLKRSQDHEDDDVSVGRQPVVEKVTEDELPEYPDQIEDQRPRP